MDRARQAVSCLYANMNQTSIFTDMRVLSDVPPYSARNWMCIFPKMSNCFFLICFSLTGQILNLRPISFSPFILVLRLTLWKPSLLEINETVTLVLSLYMQSWHNMKSSIIIKSKNNTFHALLWLCKNKNKYSVYLPKLNFKKKKVWKN